MGRNAQFDGIDAGNVTALVTEEVRKRLRERHDPSHYAASSPAAPVDDELIANCTIMKRALFNAGKRLERKHAAGQFTFALSGVYGFLVPLFTLQFEPFLTALVTYVISFTAATAGAVSFVVAMLYQQKDLARRARLFYEAGRQINKLGKDLKVIRFTETAELRRFMHHYDEILARAENHDEIDFEYARLGFRPRDNRDGRLDKWIWQRRRLDLKFGLQTYSLIAAVWLIPPMIGIAIWLTLSK